jgi:hypothetical protein
MGISILRSRHVEVRQYSMPTEDDEIYTRAEGGTQMRSTARPPMPHIGYTAGVADVTALSGIQNNHPQEYPWPPGKAG